MPIEMKDVPFFHDLSPQDIENVKKCLIEKSFKKGEIIHHEDGLCTHLFFVRSGRVNLYRTSTAGREQIYEILKAGDTCACNPGNTAWHCGATAEAMVPSVLWFLSRENYVRLMKENAALLHSLNDLFAKRLQCFSDMIGDLTLKDSKKRLVKFLLDMLPKAVKGIAKADTLYIQSTHEEIAHRLGTARETVARHISFLKRKKWIDVTPYQIVIRDKAALEKLLQ